MEKITVEKFKELLEKDENLKAQADAILSKEDESSDAFYEFAESLGYILEQSGDIFEIDDDDLENVSGGEKCFHDYKYRYKEITEDGFKRRYFRCTKCGMYMKQVTRITPKKGKIF